MGALPPPLLPPPLPPAECHRDSFGSQGFDSLSVAGGTTNAIAPVKFVACFGACLLRIHEQVNKKCAKILRGVTRAGMLTEKT